jgi:uncharacterized membrane protein
VAGWSIPLLVDGRPVTVKGSEWYAAQPRRLLWALPAVAAVIVAAIVLATRRERLVWMVAVIGLVVALVTWMAGWIGVLLDQRLSTWPLAVSVLYAISVVLVVAAAVTAPGRAPERLVAMGVVGFLVATFTLPALGVFQRGFVLSALPATAARACVTLALGCGLGWRCWQGRRWLAACDARTHPAPNRLRRRSCSVRSCRRRRTRTRRCRRRAPRRLSPSTASFRRRPG